MQVVTRAELSTQQNTKKQLLNYYSLTFLLLFFLAIAGYSLILKSFFVADDFYLLRLAKAGISPFSQNIFIFYRPLAMLTWQWSFALFGSHTSLYHLLNLAIHIFNCLLIALTLNLVVGNRKYGWLVAAVFCAYPLHPEAVTWAAGRFDLLSTTGELASFYCLVRCSRAFCISGNEQKNFWAAHKGWLWLVATLLTYTAALLCKEAALFLPLASLIYLLGDLFFRSERPRPPAILFMVLTAVLFALISGIYLVVRLINLGSYSKYDLADYNFPNYLLNSLGDVLTLLIAPVNRVLLSRQAIYLASFIGLCVLVFIVAFISFLIKIWREKQSELKLLLLLSLVWTFTSILPAMVLPYLRNAWKIGDLDGSRAFYSASFGFCVVVGVGIIEAANFLSEKLLRKPNRIVLMLAAILVCALYATILFVNNEAWVTAGKESNQVVQSFSTVVNSVQNSEAKLGKNADSDAVILMRGIPAKYKGAYVALNMFIFEDNPGEDFYNTSIPVMWQYSNDAPPDLSSVKGKTIYVAQYAVDGQGNVQLTGISSGNS